MRQNERIAFAGLDAAGAGAVVRFDVHQEDRLVGTFSFMMPPTGKGIQNMIVEAHRQMAATLARLRQEIELLQAAYERPPV